MERKDFRRTPQLGTRGKRSFTETISRAQRSEERPDQETPNLSVQRDGAVLFGAVLPARGTPTYEKPLEELKRLADTAGARVKRSLVQRRERVHPTTFVGPGMVEKIGEAAVETGADLLIADNDLSPAQAFNIEKRTGKRVVDRSELILDIFASHARTRLAKVAVELAQLEYALPRLKRLWTHLENQKGGIGLRGPGETQIETDRRLVKKKIQDLKNVLIEIQERKTREVRARQGEFTVSLVGYTNAGKSTLMRALSGRDVLVQDKLFATLDTKTAVVEVLKNRKILLSDTVGFIQKIPHHLIASFHATLEEATRADLLLHVVDASHQDPKAQVEAVEEVLRELGIVGKPTVTVLNKLDALRERIAQGMGALLAEETLAVPVANGRAIAFIRDRAEIVEETFEGETASYKIRLSKKDLGTLKAML